MSIYALKPRFQSLLRPVVGQLAARGVTANAVTLFACAVSIALGALLTLGSLPRSWFLAIPVWMLLRMGFNAVDGMLAREFNQRSALGAYLNELTDVVADAALYLPFALVAPFGAPAVAAVIFLAALTELAGVVGVMIGASRRYDGPMGKSDRAFVFSVAALWVVATPQLPPYAGVLMWLVAALTALTVVNRVRGGLRELAGNDSA